MNNFFDSTKPYSDLLGRILIAGLFVVAGIGKIANYAGTQGYMQSAGVSGSLLPLVILIEVGGGLAIILGLHTRLVAVLMAGFSIITALLFHTGHDQVSQVMLLKNFGLAGGFLFLVGNGAGKISLDALRNKK